MSLPMSSNPLLIFEAQISILILIAFSPSDLLLYFAKYFTFSLLGIAMK
jgi:hypothetical protein